MRTAATIRLLPDLTDRWMYRSAAAEYMGVSPRTLRRRNAAGRSMPHGHDDHNEPMWLKSAIDAERMFGNTPDFAEKSGLRMHHTREKRREKSHVR